MYTAVKHHLPGLPEFPTMGEKSLASQ